MHGKRVCFSIYFIVSLSKKCIIIYKQHLMLKVKFVVMNFKQQNSLQIFAVIDEFCKNMNVQMLRKKLSLCIFDYYYYGKNKIL